MPYVVKIPGYIFLCKSFTRVTYLVIDFMCHYLQFHGYLTKQAISYFTTALPVRKLLTWLSGKFKKYGLDLNTMLIIDREISYQTFKNIKAKIRAKNRKLHN